MPAVFTFTIAGNQPRITNLLAESGSRGRNVTLSWDPPPGITVLEYVVKRSKRTFALFVDDKVQTILVGLTTTLSDDDLEENTAYYYTIFWTEDGDNYYVSDTARVIGLSIKDFQERRGDDWLFEMLPDRVKVRDSESGDGQDELKHMLNVVQQGMHMQKGHVDAYRYLVSMEAMVSGRIGEADNQYAVLEAALDQIAAPKIRALGLETMRRVGIGITDVRKWKGTCKGLVKYINLLAPWDVTCQTVGEGACGGGYILRSWDGFSSTYTGTGSSLTITNLAGSLSDTAATWDPELYNLGVVIDAFGNVVCVETNGVSNVTFEAPTAQVVFEELYSIAGGDTVEITSAGKPFHDHAYKGYFLKDSAGDVFTIEDNTGAVDGLTTSLSLSGVAALGTASIAYAFDNEPKTYANREPVMFYRLHHGQHYFLFDGMKDERLRGSLEDPFDVVYGGAGGEGSITLTPGSQDVILYVADGVAVDIGESTAISAYSMEDSTKTWTVDQWAGWYLNPNRNQRNLYKVVSNSSTELFLSATGGEITRVSSVGQRYYLLSQYDTLRLNTFNNTHRPYVPEGVTPFVYFL